MKPISPKEIGRWTMGLHLFVGIGAIFGGFAAMLDPQSPMGMSPDLLRNGPFLDYFIPGLILALLIGIGNLAAALLFIKKFKFSGMASGMAGAFLIGWIVIQCYILQAVAALHVVFFLLGAAQGILALLELYLQDIFPASLIRKWLRKYTA